LAHGDISLLVAFIFYTKTDIFTTPGLPIENTHKIGIILAQEEVIMELSRKIWFGNAVIVLFILMHSLDGIFTYVGLTQFGINMEGNPLVLALMNQFGIGLGLLGAKLAGILSGIFLHLMQCHLIIASASILCLYFAVMPWAMILFR